jgi:hypothetical protein
VPPRINTQGTRFQRLRGLIFGALEALVWGVF